jgi:integrase/recombinase XerD
MKAALSEYLAELEARRYSRSRVTGARRAIERLVLYLSEAHGVRDWRAVEPKHLRAFAVWAAERHRTPKDRPIATATLRQWLSNVRCFFRWMRESGRLVGDPPERLARPTRGRELPRDLADDEIARLIETPDTETARGLRDRALMELLYATGLRHAELQRLDVYDVDLGAGRVVVRGGKGERDRIVPLTETAARWIRRYLAVARPELARGRLTGPALWLAITGRRLSYQMIGDLIRDHAAAAGVHASPHTFRHCFATHLLRGGASVRHVQALLGHAGLETTEVYTAVEIEDLKRAVERAAAEVGERVDRD